MQLPKLVRIPLIIHHSLKKSGFPIMIEHLETERTSLTIPSNVSDVPAEEIEAYVREAHPNARVLIIQYERTEGKNTPKLAQLFVAKRRTQIKVYRPRVRP